MFLNPSYGEVMTDTAKLRGMATASYWAADWAAAKAWYTELIGFEPYFLRDGYAEWRLGDYQDELGLIDSRYRPPGYAEARPAGAVTYWHVDDVEATLKRLVSLGATELDPPTERGEPGSGWMTAIAADPFGNVLGLMHSPHYLDLLNR